MIVPKIEEDNIEYLSGEVKEVLSASPSWVATWGVASLVGAISLMVFAGFIFHYPELVAGDVTITTETPPTTVMAQKSESVTEVRVKDGANVEAGDILLVFPSDAKYEDVLLLDRDLETIGQLDIEKLRSYTPNRGLRIGELAQDYSSFITAFEAVPLTAAGDIDYATVSAVEVANAQLENQIRTLQASLPRLSDEEAALILERKGVSQTYGDKMDSITLQKLLAINTKLANKQSEIKKAQARIEDLKGQMSTSNVRKLQAQTQAKAGASEAIIHLNERLDELKRSLKAWKDNFLVIATAAGRVQFYLDLKPGQFVNTGDVLFNILPDDKGVYVGKVNLPVDKSSKVKEGQTAYLKFVKYPFREYGIVPSKVSKVYPVAKDNAFYAEVTLDKGLVSNLNRELEYYPNMNGRAEIVTADKSFISKLFEKFLAIF